MDTSYGQRLASKREALGLSIEDVAQSTKVPKNSLRALEQEKHDELPAPVFVRGFIKSYAQVLGIDASEILSQYSEFQTPHLAKGTKDFGEEIEEFDGYVPWQKIEEPVTSRNGVTLAVVVLLIIATVTMSYLMRGPETAGEGVTQNTVAADTWHS